MPSFKELAKSAHRTLCRCLATIILSFCGISSFGMISIKGILGLGTAATLSIAILATASTPAFADQTSKSLDVNLTLGNSISVRILDSTATSDLSLLSFDLTPTAAGVTSTKRAIVDVSTSNITGYKLYVEANGKDHQNNYTTDLVQGDTADSHVIPTSTSTTSNKNFWNYVNPATSSATVVPSHGNPDQIGMLMSPTTSTKANVDINVGVDTTITAGSYTNQLLFTAIANAESIDYTLYFDKNAPSGVDPSTIENFPVNQTATSSATSYTFTIPDTAPTLVGYTFGGYVDPAATPGSKGSSADPYLPGEDVTVVADPSASVISGTKTLNAKWSIIRPTLTVDPDGGTWSGSSSAQTFEQDYGTTKHIDLPSANATYTISYNDNSQGASFTPTPTSAERSFTGWSLEATRAAGPGSWDPTTSTYTFGTQNGTLTATYNETSNTFTLPAITKTGHTCTWHEGSASGTSHASGEANVTISANMEFFAVCTIDSYTLTVNPNGGTWGGSSSTQEFSQNYGTTKSIANPSAGPTYSISYDGNSQSASYDPTPTSVERPFTDWTLTATPSGAAHGSFSEGTYTYGAGNDTLTANYNTTSNSFTLPQISKTGHSCKWAEGSASGTQYDGGTSRTITGNTTYFAVCTVNPYKLTVKPNGGTWETKTTDQEFTQNYGTTKDIADPSAGPTYSIDYDMGDTGITKPTSPTSVQRPFTSWTADPTSAWNSSSKVWTFPASAGTLTANYNNTSSGFTLPALPKTGYTCKWHAGSTSGTEYNPGQENVTITGNTTFYATCSINSYTLTIKPNGGKWDGKTADSTVTQNYNTRYPSSGALANATNGPTYTIDYNMGSTGITKPTSPTSVSKAFSSWTKGGEGTWNSTDKYWTFGAGDGTLTASWSNTSEGFTLPALPKTGYTCKWHAGSTSGTEYNPGQENVTITGNTTFYATCSINSYTLTIKPNGGKWDGKTADSTVTQNYNTRYPSSGALANATNGPTYTIDYNMGSTGITKPTSPTSVSKAFSSWTKGGEGTWNSTDKYWTFGAGDGTLTASWSNTSEGFTLPALSKTGHTCKWHAGSTSGTAYDGGATGVTITGNTTFYATCSINSYTLTIKPNGGKWDGKTADSTVTQNYNTRYPSSGALANATNGPTYTIDYNMGSTGITKPTSPTSVSKAFSSWTKGGEGTWNSTDKYWTFGAGDGTLTASWSNTSEGFTLPALSKTGHTCKWHPGSTSGTPAYDGGATGVTITGNTTFYATCSINSYTLTIKPNGGKWDGKTADSTVTQNYNTRYPSSGALANATNGPTYTIGYNMGSTGITKPTSPTSVSKAFSSWTKGGTGTWDATNKYWTFGAGDGTLTASWSGTSEGFTLPALSKTGNTCKWHLGSASGTEYNPSQANVTITGNSTFYATCSVNQHTVTVNAGTGIASTSGGGSKSYGSNVAISATLSAGYHFANPKWTVNSGGVTISNDSFTMPDNNVSVTANGAINTCPVKYNSNPPTGESATGSMSNSTLTYNSALTLRTNAFAVTGYDFAGWATTSGGSVVYTTSIPQNDSKTLCATHNTTVNLYAKWTAKTYTVTVNKDSNIDSVSGGGTKAYKSTVTLSATPKTGYHFSSWTVNSGGVTISNNQFTMPNNAVTVTANSAINTCPIKYNANAPSGTSASGSMANTTMTYNSTSTLRSNAFSVTGYQFAGWAESASGSVVFSNGATLTAAQTKSYCGTHNTTKNLYAKWTKKYTYTLNLNTNDGTTNKQILNYPTSGGATDTSHTFTNLNSYAPTRSGYAFLGWATTSTGTTYVTSRTLNSSSAGSTPSADGFPVTDNLYAIWEQTYTITVNASTGATVSTGQGGPWTSSITLTFKDSDTSKSFFVKTDSGYAFDQIGNCGQGYSCSGGTPGQTGTIAIDVVGTSGSMWTGSMTAEVLPTLQNQTAINTCKNAATSTTYNLYDSRDGEKYTVAKLPDGKCWMTKNLKLTGPTSGSRRLYSTDTDITATYWDLPAVDTAFGTSCSDTAKNMLVGSSDSYGAYYNWFAATAGTGTCSTSSGNAGSSICPKGWRLPTGGSNGEFEALSNHYSSFSDMKASPANFVAAGYRINSSNIARGNEGVYWSSTALSSANAYKLYLRTSGVLPKEYDRKYYGLTVRCVAR